MDPPRAPEGPFGLKTVSLLSHRPQRAGRSLLLQEDDMQTFDLSPLYRSAVGFDRMAHLFASAAKATEANSWPPYNIEQRDEHAYRVEIAVVGFSINDLSVEVREGQLVVSGRRSDAPEAKTTKAYLHRGLAHEAFDLRFHLAEHVVVKSATLDHGLLTIDLARELPEALKPRRIEIGGGRSGLLEHEREAA